VTGPPEPPWRLGADGRWYPSAPTPGWYPLGPPPGPPRVRSTSPPSAAPGRIPGLVGLLWASVVLLVVAAVGLPLSGSSSTAPPAHVSGGRVITLPRLNAPTYAPGCAASPPVPGSVTRVPMNVVRSGALVFEFVPVCIAGRGPFPFILDTGASESVVAAGLARVLGLAAIGPAGVASGVNCRAILHNGPPTRWSLGSVPLAPQALPQIAIPLFGATDAPAGLLGSDVLSRFGRVRLDFAARQLVLVGPEGAPAGGTPATGGPVPPALVQGDHYQSVPLHVVANDGAVESLVDVTIAGRSRPFVLDTGSGRSAVDASLASEAGLAASGVREVVVSVGCTRTVPLVASGAWSLGSVPLAPQLLLAVSLPPVGAVGTLGSDVLNGFGWIVVDYRGGSLLLGTPP